MIKLSSTSKVYVYCPSSIVTGGAELLHQLVNILNESGVDAYIHYFNGEANIPSEYKIYNINIAEEIDDNQDNIVVFYEGIFDKLQEVKSAQVILWWLSVDHFYQYSKRFLSLQDYFKWNMRFGMRVLAYRLGHLILRKKNYFLKNLTIRKLADMNVLNCYQSEYAQHFLLNNGFAETLPLSDYINTDFVEEPNFTNRENIILYNPKKGYKFTKKLIDASPDLKWVALVGLSRKEMVSLFHRSKIYVDFGYHPGKDRIPREATLNGCCVLTNMQGSARYFEDVAIPTFYKLDEQNMSKYEILSRIREILANYNSHIENFNYYRRKILKEEEDFNEQVKRIFTVIATNGKATAGKH